MATSGSYDWTLTRDEIITDALEDLGASNPNNTLRNQAARKLNGIVKTLRTRHIHLWTEEWVTQTFVVSSAVTNNGTTYRCIKGHTSSATDEPGVGADSSTYWIVDDAATGAVAWALTTAYTSNNEFAVAADTLGISNVFMRDAGDDYDVDIVGFAKYAEILDKAEQGRPYWLVFNRQVTPQVILHYHPDLTTYVLHYQRVRKLEDFDAGTDNWDGPVTWIPLLVKMLRYEMAGKFDVSMQERFVLKQEAEEEMRLVKREDREPEDEEYIKGAF